MKNKATSDESTSPKKKFKTDKPAENKKQQKKPDDKDTKSPKGFKKPPGDKKPFQKKFEPGGKKPFQKNAKNGFQKKGQQPQTEKPEDWNKFKKEKKELKLKRKQSKGNFDIVTRAKRIGEELRKKKVNDEKRSKLINDLHNLLKGTGEYAKFVVAHDTARIVQWQLKYSSDIVIKQISKELVPVSVAMLQSKYGIYCMRRLLKHSDAATRKDIIDKMFGSAVKLTCHSISAPVVESAFTLYATSQQKQYLVQEFYGDLYKNTKDAKVKKIEDTYAGDASLKNAVLSATKENLLRVINKSLLDSQLFQIALHQFLNVCTTEDRSEMISALSPHIVVISNSKEGSRAAMQCIWHGSNKDRKVIMKTLKEHLLDLSKHKHGHCTIISLLDTADDTVLLNKIIISELLKNVKDLLKSEFGCKVLLYLIDPTNTKVFHPVFQKELTEGRGASTSKKAVDVRRQEIRQYSLKALVDLVKLEAEFLLSTASTALAMQNIVKLAEGDDLVEAYKSVVEVICNVDWKIVEEEGKETLAVEHAGLHMVLKKLAQDDKERLAEDRPTFGEHLVKELNDNLLETWLKLNRGCFFLVAVFDNGSEKTQKSLKSKLKKHTKLLQKQTTSGAKILLQKL